MRDVFYITQGGLGYNIMRRYEDGDIIRIGTVFHKRNAEAIRDITE